ncbi:MAG: LPS export ABC transporter periplasmic protein LptC [Pseudomonadota bacterium]|nr:LPS export ABC transporter periplasmic protein LptC [Pseudomonadota bacterium]
MMRWHLVAGLMIAIFFAFWSPETDEISQSDLPPELSDRPNLYLENAKVSQFDSVGFIQYKLSSKAISQHVGTGRSTLLQPSLTFRQPGDFTWHIYSQLGVIESNLSAQNIAPNGTIHSEQSIHFTDHVRLSRDGNSQASIELHARSLWMFPQLNRVESNGPVIIKTPSISARAASFECDLEQNYLQLGSSNEQRVHLVILPKTQI